MVAVTLRCPHDLPHGTAHSKTVLRSLCDSAEQFPPQALGPNPNPHPHPAHDCNPAIGPPVQAAAGDGAWWSVTSPLPCPWSLPYYRPSSTSCSRWWRLMVCHLTLVLPMIVTLL